MEQKEKMDVNMFDSEWSNKDFLLGLIVGGSLSALLLNTKNGKKLQKEIMDKYREACEATKDLLNEKLMKKKSFFKRKLKGR